LPGVSAQGRRALREEKAATAFLVGQQDNGHRRRLASIDADRPSLEGDEIRARPPAKGLVEAHDQYAGSLPPVVPVLRTAPTSSAAFMAMWRLSLARVTN